MDIHILTDTRIQTRFSHLELAEMAFEAGIQFVQYRNKDFDPVADLAEASKMAQVATRTGGSLIVNDDQQLALQIRAQGVHLGKDDGSPLAARALLGPHAIVGATVHNLHELEALKGMAIDYIGVGPVFGTRSKSTGLPDLGLDGLQRICEASPFPVVAIGGVDLQNILEVKASGAAGAAILSGFCLAENPSVYASQLLELFA